MMDFVRDFFQKMLNFVFNSSLITTCKDILSLNPSVDGFATIWNIVCQLYNNVCVPLGMGLVLIYFMYNLIERSIQQQQIDVEQIIKLLLKLAFGLYFVKNGLTLMADIYSLGISFLNSVVGATAVDDISAGEAVVHGIWTAITGEEWEGSWTVLDFLGKAVPIIWMCGLPLICTLIISLVCIAVCYFRLIEFYIMTCAAPIAMSDFFTEGTHSNGWKFVKNYLSLALQMGIIMLAIIVFNGIIAAVMPSAEEMLTWQWISVLWFWIKYLAIGASLCAVILKSRSIAKEIVGVQ